MAFTKLTSAESDSTTFVVIRGKIEKQLQIVAETHYRTAKPNWFCGTLNENAGFSPIERTIEFALTAEDDPFVIVVPLDYRNPNEFKAKLCSWRHAGTYLRIKEQSSGKLLHTLWLMTQAESSQHGYSPQPLRTAFDVTCGAKFALRSCSEELDPRYATYFVIPPALVQSVKGGQEFEPLRLPHLKVNARINESL